MKISCFLPALFNSLISSPANDCPQNWQPYDEFCYYVNEATTFTYEEARTACVNEEATLTSIHNQAEQNFHTRKCFCHLFSQS